MISEAQGKLIAVAGIVSQKLLGIPGASESVDGESDLSVFKGILKGREIDRYKAQAREMLTPHLKEISGIADTMVNTITAKGPGSYDFTSSQIKGFANSRGA